MALDTLAYARRLREAGFSEQQAEGQAEALAATMTDTLATKQDLGLLRQDTKLSNLERRMTTRLGGITVAGVGVVAALVRVL